MMYEEFLEIAGVSEDEVTFKVYNDIIEPMYMGSNLDKREFVKFLNVKAIIENTENPARYAKEIIKAHKDRRYDDVIRGVKKYAESLGGLPEWYEHIELGLFDVVYRNKNDIIRRIDSYQIQNRKIKKIKSEFY